MKAIDVIDRLGSNELTEKLQLLYGTEESVLQGQRRRYTEAIKAFQKTFPDREDIHLFSAPGRTEIGGNHTDHQRGCALAAAINLDVIAVVSFHTDGVIRFQSEGYSMMTVDLSDLSVQENEKGTSSGILRGIAASFAERGINVGGFDAYSVSDVLPGSGLSSSAAFEILAAQIINSYYNQGRTDAVEMAKIGQYAENVYFGKASGLLDQVACSVGGFAFIDFEDVGSPLVKKNTFDFEGAGYRLCITDTKGSHSDLTDDYSAVPREMKSVAAYFGKEVLREVEEEAFQKAIPDLRGHCSDRAILRALHFFEENRRAILEAEALEKGDFTGFLSLYRQSAASSANLLQNLYPCSRPQEQGISLAIAVSRLVLGQEGAVRVHGGGFAGTIQAFVPAEKTEEYVETMDSLFGSGSCYIIRIRPAGGIQLI